ncbi:MAG: TadE/TadG family type IV pilus assembly protein [Terriglobia bacterium]
MLKIRAARLIQSFRSSSSGQSLVEAALLVPVLLALAFNAINFGYFFLVALNVAAAPRSGVEYAIQGFASPSAISAPAAGPSSADQSVSYLTYQDMTGALYSPSRAIVRVCSQRVGLRNPGGSSQTSKCAAYGGRGALPAPDSDPESPDFVLNRVDVAYSFSPLIPGRIFNILVLASPVCASSGGSVSCTFHRYVEMREMN